jgi:hypothetical protein
VVWALKAASVPNRSTSAEIEKRIDELLAGEMAAGGAHAALSELAHLGARLIIQRAVEEEFDAFLGRQRYELRADALPGKRNGRRTKRRVPARAANKPVMLVSRRPTRGL